MQTILHRRDGLYNGEKKSLDLSVLEELIPQDVQRFLSLKICRIVNEILELIDGKSHRRNLFPNVNDDRKSVVSFNWKFVKKILPEAIFRIQSRTIFLLNYKLHK